MEAQMPVTLQINLCPTDFAWARHTLPHQLRVLGPSVREILLVLDLDRGTGKFGEAWEERLPKLNGLIAEHARADERIRVEEVDYSPDMQQRVAAAFTAGRRIPRKDARGAPIYGYLFGLHRAAHDHVIHLDSDMMLGGTASGWVDDAVSILQRRSDIVAVNPLPGPPTPERVVDQPRKIWSADDELPGSFRFTHFSTRIFLIDRKKLMSAIGPLTFHLAPPVHAFRGLRRRYSPYRSLEHSITVAMRRAGVFRLDTPGSRSTLWSVHPRQRGDAFYQRLPEIIRAVESDAMPEAQRGRCDLIDEMVFGNAAGPS